MSEIAVTQEKPKPNPPKTSTRSLPKWEEKTRTRIHTELRKLVKPTIMLKEKDAAEADTRHLVTDILVDLLGYDKYENLTAEFNVKGDWADYGIRIKKQLIAFVEVKRISQKLMQSHLRQVESYALKEGVRWAILTNAQVWQAYYVRPVEGQQSEVDLVLEVDLLDESIKPATKTDLMFMLSKEGMTQGRLEEYRAAQGAISAKTLLPILTSERVLIAVRKEVKLKTKYLVNQKDLKAALTRILEL